MNKTGKVNGFRIMCRLAMAELMYGTEYVDPVGYEEVQP